MTPAVRPVMRRLALGKAPWPWFLFGSVGTGKTCAALCLLDFAGGEYYTAGGWAETLNQARDGRLTGRVWSRTGPWGDSKPIEGMVWPENLWSIAARAPLFVLDEVGARKTITDHQYECVKRLIDDRHGKPLVMISNHDLQTIGELYGAPVADRLHAGTVTELSGPSRRGVK